MDRFHDEALGATPFALPRVPALQHPLTAELTGRHRDLLRQLSHGLGSTLHVLLPEVFADNARQFKRALGEAGVSGFVLFAKKANKGRGFVEQCPALGIGVDAASLQEAEQALGCGVPGAHIGITGPGKHPALLNLALRQRCLVAIDSVEELRVFAAQARQTVKALLGGYRGRVLLRCRPASQPRSRFGMSPEEREAALQLCLAHRDVIDMEGFSFHLSGYSIAARAEEAHRMIDACLDARSRGLALCASINIGGGFAVRYVDEAHWSDFLRQQQPRHYHAGKSFDDFYPYYSAAPGHEMLSTILAHAVDGRALALRLREHDIRVLLEPGRALLDQAGFTAFEIQSVKHKHGAGDAGQDYGIVTVGGTSFSLSEQWFNSEYIPDPLLLPRQDGAVGDAYAACVGGASCLDGDMVSWRKIRFPQPPQPGDLLLYLNTAGYQMDSNESPFHDLPLPAKVVVTMHQGKPCWRLDSRPHADFA
ncbi:alanine racemase [Herbaspirillum sp.]|uniref:alanine racemase n=1 Tax=Herbaspirillum sp. TaxID=1890675 RepID=UPI0031DCFBC6